MSTEFGYISTMDGNVHLTKFWGGADHGVAVQLTPATENPFICLSAADCFNLFIALSKVFDVDTVKEEEREGI